MTSQELEFIEGQITELLTNYGEIKMLFIDGWSWKMGHVAVPYDQIRALVKRLQPSCLLVDNTHLQCLYENDMIHYEAGSICPSDNTLPALQSALINKNSGDDWFWDPRVPTANLMSVNEIVKSSLEYLEPRWCTFVLNCPPNRDGRLDSNIVSRLRDVGAAWNPDTARPLLPSQPPFNENPVLPVSASSTSGNATYAIDGLNDRYYYSVWQSSSSLPQSITLDLGKQYGDICMLQYVPKYKTVATATTEGSIQSYRISKSIDNLTFTQIDSGIWNGDSKMKVATFAPTEGRYIRLEAFTALNSYAAATEIAIGRESIPTKVGNLQRAFVPNGFVLLQNYPNPFNPDTRIRYSPRSKGYVRLSVHDLLGREVASLVNAIESAGAHEAKFSGAGLCSGIYFYRLQCADGVITRKMALLK